MDPKPATKSCVGTTEASVVPDPAAAPRGRGWAWLATQSEVPAVEDAELPCGRGWVRTLYRRHSPGMPLSSWAPRSSNASPEPATRSFTVLVTRTSPGLALVATRAPVCTAIPATFPSISSHSPVCNPTRTFKPSSFTASAMAHAQRAPSVPQGPKRTVAPLRVRIAFIVWGTVLRRDERSTVGEAAAGVGVRVVRRGSLGACVTVLSLFRHQAAALLRCAWPESDLSRAMTELWAPPAKVE